MDGLTPNGGEIELPTRQADRSDDRSEIERRHKVPVAGRGFALLEHRDSYHFDVFDLPTSKFGRTYGGEGSRFRQPM
jgi:hypothetical protein